MQSPSLFDAVTERTLKRPALPVIGEQKDIRYYGTRCKSVLNDTDVTGWASGPSIHM